METTHHLVGREEEVRHGAGEIEEAFAADPTVAAHDLADRPQQPEVLVDCHVRHHQQRPLRVGVVMALEDGQHPCDLCRVDGDACGLGRVRRRRLDPEKVEERPGRVRVVAREGKERVLPVEKDDGVALGEKVLC